MTKHHFKNGDSKNDYLNYLIGPSMLDDRRTISDISPQNGDQRRKKP